MTVDMVYVNLEVVRVQESEVEMIKAKVTDYQEVLRD